MTTPTPGKLIDSEVPPPAMDKPKGWLIVAQQGRFGTHYVQPPTRFGLSVIRTASIEQDGRTWLHVSVARPMCLPTWAELTTVKELFIGPDRIAYQVLPPKSEWVNVHPYCLHLWSPLDGDRVTPDFRLWGML